MAELVIAIGSSHGPSIQTTPETWERLAEKDVRDPRFDYQALLKAAKPGLEAEISIDVRRTRHAAAQSGLAVLNKTLCDADVDVAIVISNAHQVRAAEPHPVFGILRARDFPSVESVGSVYDPGAEAAGQKREKATELSYQKLGHPELANHVLERLIEEGFDVASIDRLPEGALLDEAFAFCDKWLFGSRTVPVVPFFLSRDLPNQATPKRCLELGRALRAQIESCPLPLRVGLVASGGLSHQVVDEALDRQVVEALVAADFDTLRGLRRDRLNRAPGTPEILNWVTVSAAMAPTRMSLVEYLPCYRSLAGTGQGVCLGYWKPSA